VVVNADMYLNGDIWESLTPREQKAIEVAANASLSKAMSYRIIENGKALKDLVDNHGVILVWQSQKDFAEIAVPFWAGAQTSNASLGKAFADSLE